MCGAEKIVTSPDDPIHLSKLEWLGHSKLGMLGMMVRINYIWRHGQIETVWERPTHEGKQVQPRLRKAHGQLRELVLHKAWLDTHFWVRPDSAVRFLESVLIYDSCFRSWL